MKKEFDLIVIGAGSGLDVANASAQKGLKTAIVNKGPLGGTCLNKGCIPSKMLLHTADIAEEIASSKNFFIRHKGFNANFKKIVDHVSSLVDSDAKSMKKGLSHARNPKLFVGKATFIDERTIKVGPHVLYGKKILIATGARPRIPTIPGLDTVPYMTSAEALRLTRQPKNLIIIGGGYIGSELAHFFGALGTQVTIIQRGEKLVPTTDEDIAEAFTIALSKKYDVLLDYDTKSVSKKGSTITVIAETRNGRKKIVTGDALLVAVGVVPNTDMLNLDTTGVTLDKRGYIETTHQLQTSNKNIYALGDVIGRYLFKHVANHEVHYAYRNMVEGREDPVDYSVIPWAIFSSPQVAGVGMTESQVRKKKISYAKGVYEYKNTGMGEALHEKHSFVKVLINKKTERILGCHIIGPQASTLIHEVILAMTLKATVSDVLRTIHVHPALSEVVYRAFASVDW